LKKEIAMKNMKAKKQGGFVLTAELVLIVTILVFGSIVGMVSMRDALNAEMGDVAESMGSLDQSYDFDGLVNGQSTATTAGSTWNDDADTLAGDDVADDFVAAIGSAAADNFAGATATAAITGNEL